MPRSPKIVDKDGRLTQHWENSFMNLYQVLQANFKTTGYLIPSVNATDLQAIQNQYQEYVNHPLPPGINNIAGQLAFNTTTNYLNQFVIANDENNNIFLAQWVPLGVLLLNAGDPNSGSGLGALVGWFCYDLTHTNLYVCTTQGAAGTAVWTIV